VEKHGAAPCVGSCVHHRRTGSNGMRSASMEEEGPHNRNQCHLLASPRSEGGIELDPWVDEPICVLDEETNASPVPHLRRTEIFGGRCFATTTDCDFRPEHDPAQYPRRGRRTCFSCACWPLFLRMSVVPTVGNAEEPYPSTCNLSCRAPWQPHPQNRRSSLARQIRGHNHDYPQLQATAFQNPNKPPSPRQPTPHPTHWARSDSGGSRLSLPASSLDRYG
jgi:hypothetical protein